MYPAFADDICKPTQARNPLFTGLCSIRILQRGLTWLQWRFGPRDDKDSEEVADGVSYRLEQSPVGTQRYSRVVNHMKVLAECA